WSNRLRGQGVLGRAASGRRIAVPGAFRRVFEGLGLGCPDLALSLELVLSGGDCVAGTAGRERRLGSPRASGRVPARGRRRASGLRRNSEGFAAFARALGSAADPL